MKRGKGVTVILVVSILLILSVPVVSAAWYDFFPDWFKNLFKIGEDSDLKGGLATLSPGITDSLVLYYNLNDDVLDSSGNNYDGIINGNPSYVEGINGSGLRFDGDDYVDTTYDPILDNSFSYSLWFKADSITADSLNIFLGAVADYKLISSDDYTSDDYQLGSRVFASYGIDNKNCGNGKIGFSFRDSDNSNTVTDHGCSVNTTDDGEWHHTALVYGASDIKLFIDGQLEKSIPTTSISSGPKDLTGFPFYVGARNGFGNPNLFFNGVIDEVMIFDKSLSEGEVLEIYNEQKPTCTDSDVTLEFPDGINYGVEGIVYGLEGPNLWDTWTDYCGTSGEELGNLIEYSCDANKYGKKNIYDCFLENKICQNGACVEKPITPDPISHYEFSGNADDSVGDNHGSLIGGASTVFDSVKGNVLSLDGIEDYVEVEGYGGIGGANNRSVIAWIKSSEIMHQTIVYWGQTITGQKYRIRLEQVADEALLRVDFTGGWIVGTTNLGDGKWHQVAITFSGTNVTDHKLYVDANLETISSIHDTIIDTSILTNVVLIGNGQDIFFNGSIDDVMIFNKSLNSSEILDIYNEQKPITSDPISHYEFDENADDSVGDNHGSLIGGASTVFDSVKGNVLSLDGIEDYVDLANFSELNGASEFTASIWVKPNNLPFNEWKGIFGLNSDDTNVRAPWIFGTLFKSTVYMQFSTVEGGNTDCNLQMNQNLTQDKWNLLTFTWNGSTCNSYLNGEFDNFDTTIGSTLENTDWFNAIGYINNYGFFNGTIDDVMIYDKALSAEEIQGIYDEQKPIGEPTNPISYYEFNGNADDSVGENHGSLIGDAEIVSDPVKGNVLSLDGIEDYVNIDNILSSLSSTTTGTWSAWIKPLDATPTSAEMIIHFGDTDANERLEIDIPPSGVFRALATDEAENSWNIATTGMVFSDNTWTHVVIVHNGIEPVLYVNGVRVNQIFNWDTNKTKWFNVLTGLDNARIGSRNYYNRNEENFFNGLIDDVMIYNKALSEGEILEIYDEQKQLQGSLSNNKKNISKYSNKEVFLISDKNWKNILPLVPVSIWTDEFGINKYPTLIYHEEEEFDYDFPTSSESSSDTEAYGQTYSVNGKSLVRFYLDEYSKREFLKLDLDVASIGSDYVEVILSNSEKDYFENVGYDLETIPIYNPFTEEGYSLQSGYHTYNSMVEELNNLSQDYPNIAKVYEIGQSIENRSILAMKVSDNVETEEGEKQILIVGNHHAREIMTVEVPIFMINYLLDNYDTDANIKNVVDNHELWFVPMVNPDGHVIVETTDPYWRKNARDNNGDGLINFEDGVDLNRNYGYTWAYDDIGSSPYPDSSSYRGTSSFSEPETQAIRDLVLNHSFEYVLDYHSSGGNILYPWGHISEVTPDDNLFSSLASDFNKFLKYQAQNIGPIYQVMYYSNGDSIGWHYGEQENKSKIIAFGFELNPDGGFSPPSSYIQPTAEKQLMVLLNLTGYPIEFGVSKKIDADSAIYFMQQYSTDKITIIGDSSQELDNLLIAAPDLGVGLQEGQIQRINLENYLSYWETFEDVVYVEDNYELALLASTYASLINAPLIIQGTSLDDSIIFSQRNVTCVGSVIPPGSSCNEEYNLEQLQDKYLNETQTKKIILTNSDDLEIIAGDLLYPDKSSGPISEVYGKTSLISPFLASAKHELITIDKTNDYQSVDDNIESFFNNNYDENILNCLYSDSCASGFSDNPVNMAGVSNSITFFLTGSSDLDIINVNAPYPISVGSSVELDIEVRNNGFDIAENVTLQVYWINDSDAPIENPGGGGGTPGYSSYSSQFVLLDTINLGSILEDNLINAISTWIPEEVGENILYFNVSTSSDELNLLNNDYYRHLTVTGPSPDLEVSVDYPNKMLVDSFNIFNISISNIGTDNAGEFDIKLYETDWDCSSGICEQILNLIDNVTISSLNSNENIILESGFTPLERDWYDFRVIVELADDANEFNNIEYFSILAAALEPEIYYNWEFIPKPSLININNEIELTLFNSGFEDAQNTIVEFYLEEPGESNSELVERINIGSLNSSGKTVYFNWTPIQQGWHYIYFNITYESSLGTGNREIYLSKEVKIPGPDLDVWLYAENVEFGGEAFAQIVIENEGTDAVYNFSYYFYDNNELIESVSGLPLLVPGEQIIGYVYWTPDSIGVHNLKLVVESDEDVNLENNEYIRQIQTYSLKNTTFEIINNTADHISRYLGIAYNWGYPETVDLITEPSLFVIPDVETDIWIIESESMDDEISEDIEYITTRFIGSNLHNNMLVISKDYKDVRTEGDKRLYRIYANEIFWNYRYARVIFNYPDYSVIGTEPENLTIYSCENWDFDYEICLSGWESPYWVDKYIEGDRLYMSAERNNAEAYAIGESVTGSFAGQIREPEEIIDFSKIIKEYKNKQEFFGPVFGTSDNFYQLYVPGFFYNCPGPSTYVNISFNEELVKTRDINCYTGLPSNSVEEYLAGQYHAGVKNITLDFEGDLIFYDLNQLLGVSKNGYTFYLSEEDSSGVGTVPVSSFGGLGESKFAFENNDYVYFVVNIESSGSLSDFDVYLNDLLIGEVDLINSNGKKARGFKIPEPMLNEEMFNITVNQRNPVSTYLADVKMKSDFDDYYLTIVASPEAIPFRDSSWYETDFRRYGSLDEDYESEFSVGRIMGITPSDVSAYLSRVLFYEDIPKKTSMTMMMRGDPRGDPIYQGIPESQCGTSFCKCYFDDECVDIFDKYSVYFDSSVVCDESIGLPQPPECDARSQEMVEGIYNSSFVMYGDHGSPTGWAGIIYTSSLENLPPEFAYTFACSTCEYGYTKSNLFCTNMLRRGAIGFIGAVSSIPGHNFLDEFLYETLINNKSIGYAFKIGKNKEPRLDWGTKKTPSAYGVHDILIGDPSFDGRLGK